IGIYHELTTGHALGGTECVVAMLGEALQPFHQVEIVNHSSSLTKEQLAEFSGTSLPGVRLRYVPLADYPCSSSLSPWRRYRAARAWHAALSAPYELFINFIHGRPPFCHAPKGVLVVLFPFFIPPNGWVGSSAGMPDRSLLRKLRYWYHDWEWKRR